MFAETREERGKAIADTSGVRRISADHYAVASQSRNIEYHVKMTETGWKCSCPDHTHRNVKCKHSWAVEFSLSLREKVASRIVLAPIQIHVCPICASDQIVKHGIRHNRSGDIQRYTCESSTLIYSVQFGVSLMAYKANYMNS